MACRVDHPAALKILLHAAKYPVTGVNGFLIGKIENGGSEAGAKVQVTDALPVLHNYVTLTPVLEAALPQALQHASSCKQQVVGYYQANERLEDRELGAVGRKVAEKLHSLSKGSVGLVLDAPALKSYLKYAETNPQAAPEAPLFQAWSCDARGQATAPARAALADPPRLYGALADPPRLYGALVEATSAGVHRRLVDFEDHLQDISLNWLNPALLP